MMENRPLSFVLTIAKAFDEFIYHRVNSEGFNTFALGETENGSYQTPQYCKPTLLIEVRWLIRIIKIVVTIIIDDLIAIVVGVNEIPFLIITCLFFLCPPASISRYMAAPPTPFMRLIPRMSRTFYLISVFIVGHPSFPFCAVLPCPFH